MCLCFAQSCVISINECVKFGQNQFYFLRNTNRFLLHVLLDFEVNGALVDVTEGRR